jgi:CRP-like cAMP-binding protein
VSARRDEHRVDDPVHRLCNADRPGDKEAISAIGEALCAFRVDPTTLSNLLRSSTSRRHLSPGERLVSAGDTVDLCWFVISGILERASHSVDGNRHILGFHFPGEVCALTTLGIDRIDHDLEAATDSDVFPVTHADLWKAAHSDASALKGLAYAVSIQSIRSDRWIASLSLSARERVAFLLSECFGRLDDARMANEMFGTQTTIATATGLSLVHVNRVLQRLVRDGLLGRAGRRFTLTDQVALRKICGVYEDQATHPRAATGDLRAVS